MRTIGTRHVAPGLDVLMRVLIVNPNTSRATNARIGAIAAPLFREPDAFEVVSAPSGIELIETVAQSNATVPALPMRLPASCPCRCWMVCAAR